MAMCGIGISAVPSLPKAVRRVRLPYPASAPVSPPGPLLLMDSHMPYTPILATLGYVFSPDGKRVLLIHRNANANDQHLGKFNGLGGKLDGQRRRRCWHAPRNSRGSGHRVRSTRTARNGQLARIRQHGEDWFGFIFRVTAFSGTPLAKNPEGELEWVNVNRVLELPLWEGDRFFMPMVFDPRGRPFHGVMPYKDGRPVSWSFSTL